MKPFSIFDFAQRKPRIRFKLCQPFFLLAIGIFAAACQPPNAINSNGAATATANNAANAASNANGAIPNVVVPAAAMIETNEPAQYQATVTLKIETSGGQNSALPEIRAAVARDGANQRMEFNVPNMEKIVYLDRADKRLLLLPARKQFAELNQQSVGFEIRQLISPGQIVAQARNLKGVELVGDEQFNGRAVTKYRYNATNKTNSEAGDVKTDSFVLVDKETGLPLRSETFSQAQNGNVQGVNAVRFVTEMTDIKTSVESDLFEPPADYKQIAPEAVRAQVNTIFGVAAGLFGQLMQKPQTNNQPNNQNAANVQPTVSPTP